MKVSVIITTYNGEKFIQEQLESILKQTYKPDEVIISDDNSKDNTINIIKKFIKKNSLDNWFLFKNKKNKGWRKNFIEAIPQTTGDIIFFSDQDDIWLENKIELMSNAMIKDEKILYLSGKSIIIDMHNHIKEKKILKNKYSKNIKKISHSYDFFNYNNLGCTISVRRSLAIKLKKISCFELGHDKQLFMLSSLYNCCYKFDYPVIKHRIHDNNVTNAGKFKIGKNTKKNRVKKLEDYINWINKVMSNKDFLHLNQYSINNMKRAKKIIEMRIELLKKGKIFNLFKLIFFKVNYLNLKKYLGDLFYFYKSSYIIKMIISKLKSFFNDF